MGPVRDVYACRLPLDGDGRLAYERAVGLVLTQMTGQKPQARDAWIGGSVDRGAGSSLRWRLLSAPGVGDRLHCWPLWRRYSDDPKHIEGNIYMYSAVTS